MRLKIAVAALAVGVFAACAPNVSADDPDPPRRAVDVTATGSIPRDGTRGRGSEVVEFTFNGWSCLMVRHISSYGEPGVGLDCVPPVAAGGDT